MRTKEQILQVWNLLTRPGEVREFRAPKCGRYKTVSGYFDNAEGFAKAVEQWNGQANLYLTLNPVNPALLSRCANKTQPYAETTTADTDIVCRQWLPVDLDAVRPAGISASHDEHTAALERATAVREFLSQYGIACILADSGNGAHLLVRIDLPNDDASRLLIEAVLAALGLMFDDSTVKVDTTCSNAARIWKIYGSLACKGDNTPDRPHRYARVMDVPDSLAPVSITSLQQIAELAPKPPMAEKRSPRSNQSSDMRPLDVPGFITTHGLRILREGPYKDGRKWIIVCPFNPDHTDNSAVIIQFGNGAVAFRCHHNGCQGRDWRALREMLEPERSSRNGDQRQDTVRNSTATDYEQNEFNENTPEEPVEQPRPELAPDAYQGVIGEIVKAIEPHTEADPAAILIQMLIGFGNVIGRSAYQSIEASRHFSNLFVVIVGRSSRGRKGTSFGYVRNAIAAIDAEWATKRILSGLSTGEGVIHEVRDPVEEPKLDKKTGKTEIVVTDFGATDKRLLVVEEEFARSLRVMEREGSTLSAIIRQSWDHGNLRVMTKSPVSATNGHISIIGHITQDELLRYLTTTEAMNGFANRFLWIYSARTRLLPFGGQLDDAVLLPLYSRLAQSVDFAKACGPISLSSEVREMWRAVYPQLTEELPGMIGAVTSRSEAQVRRLAAVYALADGNDEVQPEHLKAALALWEYSEASCRYLFGDALGDTVADQILAELKRRSEGMDRTEITRHFGNNIKATRIQAALNLLLKHRLATCERQQGDEGGRRREVWRAARKQGGA